MYELFSILWVPSILAKGDRYVLRYFRKYGFQNVTLTLLILEPGATLGMVRELEQYYIDTLCSNLNEDEFVRRPGMAPKFAFSFFVQ